MKKLVAIILTLSLTAALAACGGPSDKEIKSAGDQEDALAPEPTPETALSIADITEGTYAGTLSGDGYSNDYDDGAYTLSPDISPAELYIVVSGGQVTLYCAARVSSGGAVLGVEAPRSPSYTHTVYGSLPLEAVDESTVGAEGELTSPSETIWIYWDENKAFTNWEVVQNEDSSYRCSVTITLSDGVPVAEVSVDGSSSHRTATIPLTPENQADAPLTLWSNVNALEVKNDAKDYYVMFPLPDCTVTELETSNLLSGGKAPGQLMLYGEDGSEYGPFDAVGREGADGTANAYWVAEVSIELPAGRYAVADSDEATWSNNGETEGRGMATVRGTLK